MPTSPVPDAAAPPGMCPGIVVLSGGMDDGGGSGNAKGGKNGKGGGGKGNGDDGSGDGKSAGCSEGGDGSQCPNHHGTSASGTASAGDPVDVVTGRVFTTLTLEFELAGPLPLRFERFYNSDALARDVGLGLGFSHSFAWEVIEQRQGIILRTHDGLEIEFNSLKVGEGQLGPHGWVLHRDGPGFALDLVNGQRLLFHELASTSPGTRWRLSDVIDSHNNRLRLVYREEILAEIVDSVGRIARFVPTRDRRVAAIVLNSPTHQGQRVYAAQYTYDSAGRLIAAEDADGVRTTYGYDDQNRLVLLVRPSGLQFKYRYDDADRCVETWGEYANSPDPSLATDVPSHLADGVTLANGVHHVTLDFGPDGYSEVSTSTSHHRYFGNVHGKLDKAIAGSNVFTREFDEYGYLRSFTDACGATTIWERDIRGRETKVVDALGGTTLISRDADGHIRKMVDCAGGVTVAERDAGAFFIRDAMGAMFEIRFESRGLVEHTVAPNGDVTKYTYDYSGNLVEVGYAHGGTSKYVYDAWGRCITSTDASGATTQYDYTLAGRLLSIITPDGEVTRYEYDSTGRVVAKMDAMGRSTISYGGHDRACDVEAPDGSRVSFRYDREGRLATVTNERGEIHKFVRRFDGLTIEEQTFDGRRLRYGYDAMGRIISMVNGAGELVEVERDILGRMIRRKCSDGHEELFEYDARGDVVRATAGDIEITFERNALGWIMREIQSVGDERVVVDLEYDHMGRINRRTTSLRHSLAWERTGKRTLVRLGEKERLDIEHDEMGREVCRVLPHGAKIESVYDIMGRLASRFVHSATKAIHARPKEPAWLGEASGDLTVEQRNSYLASLPMTRWDRSQGLTRFQYDPLGRLISVLPEVGEPELFQYDVGGNLQDISSTRRYDVGGRLLETKDIEYLWDQAGRVVEARHRNGQYTRYEWSAAGRLLAVVRNDGQRVEFQYDPFNRRLLKRTMRVEGLAARTVSTTRFVWDATTLAQERTSVLAADGKEAIHIREYCFEEERSAPRAHRDIRLEGSEWVEGDWVHYINDDTGAPERLVDGSGRISCELKRSAWGRFETPASAATSTSFGFRGQYIDKETGLHYNFHRYYDPGTGRYLSADPIGLHGGLDAFAYAGSCPTSAVDVEGLMYSVIKDKHGRVVADGHNLKERKGIYKDDSPFDTSLQDKGFRDSCAESAAINKLAQKIRAESTTKLSDEQVFAKVKSRFAKEGYTIETYEGNKDHYEGNNRIIVNPCPYCAQMISEQLNISNGQVLAANRQSGSKRTPVKWDGKSTYKPSKKHWLK